MTHLQRTKELEGKVAELEQQISQMPTKKEVQKLKEINIQQFDLINAIFLLIRNEKDRGVGLTFDADYEKIEEIIPKKLTKLFKTLKQ